MDIITDRVRDYKLFKKIAIYIAITYHGKGIETLIAEHRIGGRIAGLRASMNVTQLELAKAAGVSTAALRNIEYDYTAPRLETLIKLSDFFKVSIDYLVHGVESDGDNLATYRETGLNDTALAFLGEQIDLGKNCGGLNEYIATLNAIVAEGLPKMVWGLMNLNAELKDINAQIRKVMEDTPTPGDIVDEMRLSNLLEPLRERRDLLKLRFLRSVEKAFDNLTEKGDGE